MNRRQFLQTSAGVAATSFIPWLHANEDNRPKTVAAVVTGFKTDWHADVIANRWLEGFELDGKSDRPQSKLVSMYTDQVPSGDISRPQGEKHKIPIFKTIREALCLGGDKLAVDGVLLIGEHGNYPYNDKGQHLYPRRRFFEETVAVFRDSGRSVPVFNDKHLSFSWENAKWMYDQSVELKFPFMAGSSLPGAWRIPPRELELGSPVEEALVVSYSGVEVYGFHALETLQCILERRKGAETGVAAVTCLEGPSVWKAAEEKRWPRRLLDAALTVATDRTKKGRPEDHCKNPAAMLLEYKDGCRATVLMLTGFTDDFLVAAPIVGKSDLFLTNFWLQPSRPHGHFSFLVQGIDRMFMTGKPSWPVERTLLTTGILDAVMTSRSQGHKRQETPHLAVKYQAGPAWQPPSLPRTGPPVPTKS